MLRGSAKQVFLKLCHSRKIGVNEVFGIFLVDKLHAGGSSADGADLNCRDFAVSRDDI